MAEAFKTGLYNTKVWFVDDDGERPYLNHGLAAIDYEGDAFIVDEEMNAIGYRKAGEFLNDETFQRLKKSIRIVASYAIERKSDE